MAIAYKCDACGKYYAARGLRISNDKKSCITRVTFINNNGFSIDSFDLCDDCLKKVLDILGVKTERIEEDKK